MSEQLAVTRNRLISELTKSAHADLSEYARIGLAAANEQPEFFGHLVAWNQAKGQVRDSKVALPVVALASTASIVEDRENALAALASQSVRDFAEGVGYALKKQITVHRIINKKRTAITFSGLHPAHGNKSSLYRLVERYLRNLEDNWAKWERTAVQHRQPLKWLYHHFHIKHSALIDQILFEQDYPKGSVFEAIHNLPTMGVLEAAGTIIEKRIPFLVAVPRLGPKAKDPAVVQALIERMSPTDLTNNAKLLEKLGVSTNPALRAAYREALNKKVATNTKANVLRTTKAVAAVEDEGLKERLKATQEKQLASIQGIDGNWLILADRSGSMQRAIEVARQLAGTLAKLVRGQVRLVFFDTSAFHVDVTGMTYEEIKAKTSRVAAGGGTSIGCGLLAALDGKFEIDGIAIVSDGEENTAPYFAQQYKALVANTGKQVPVYFYRINVGYNDTLQESMRANGFDLQVFELSREKTDEYSIANVVQTMRANRYSLVQEVMDTPLLTLDAVLPVKVEKYAACAG